MQQTIRLLGVIGLLLSVHCASAQFTRGSRMVGASIASGLVKSGTSDQTVTGISSRTVKETGYSISLAPSMGWFVSENTAVGALLRLSPNSEKLVYEENGNTYQSDKKSSFDIGLGAFARNYFSRSGSLLPYAQLAFDVGISSQSSEGFFYGGTAPSHYKDTYDGKSSGGFLANIVLTGGATKMVSDRTGLDFYIGYNYLYGKNTTNRTTSKDIGIDGTIDETGKSETVLKYTSHRFVFGVGFMIFLEKKKR